MLLMLLRAKVTVAFMMLVEDGLVRLEDPVAKFLPAFTDVQVHFGHAAHPLVFRE